MSQVKRWRKIKVVEVIADSSLTGGPRHVLGLISKIDKKKFDVLLVAPRGWLISEATKIAGVEIRIVDFKSKFDLRSLLKLRGDIAQFRARRNPFGPIIIHAHGPRAGYFCRIGRRSGEKFVYTEHIWSEEYQIRNYFNKLVQLSGIRSICRSADLIIAVSKSVKKFLISRKIAYENKIAVIPNAIEATGEKFPERKSRQKELLVGTVGALVPRKGQKYLLRAFARVAESLPKARLEIVGEGSERQRLQREIKSLGLEAKVQLLGEQKKPKKFLDNWDLFVLPSISEVFGIVILEAFESGLPVIASNVGGVPEIIKNGENGVLVPPANVERLAKAISWLLAEKKDRLHLGRAGFESLKKNFDWSKIIVEIEGKYQKLF